MTDIQLTEEQNQAIAHVLTNLGVGTQALAGPAGSGKTTLIKELIERIPGGATICAMTNKARFVLAQKGLPEALTLHQACLRPKFKPPLDELQKYLQDCRIHGAMDCLCDCTCSEATNGFRVSKIGDKPCDLHGRSCKFIAPKLGVQVNDLVNARSTCDERGIYPALKQLGIKDVFKYIDGWQPADEQDGVLIIDEASMLGGMELDMVQRVYKRIVLVGDEFQLPPVSGAPMFWQIPTRFALTTIHRQAAASQPLQLAQKLRNKQSIEVDPVVPIDLELCKQGCPVIVWTNKTRINVTNKIREALGYKNMPPQVGEALICRNGSDRDAKGRGLFNNSIWKVIGVSKKFVVTLENEAGDVIEDEHVAMEELDNAGSIPFRFAYALTCHSAQGSEWPHVMIHEKDAFGFMHFSQSKKEEKDSFWKWLYTGVTRAKDQVHWVHE